MDSEYFEEKGQPMKQSLLSGLHELLVPHKELQSSSYVRVGDFFSHMYEG